MFKKSIMLMVLLSSLLTGCSFFDRASAAANYDYKIVFIDVGYGNAILLHSPSDFDVLIDGGDSLTRIEPTLQKYVTDNTLEVVVATNFNRENVNGLIELINSGYAINKVYYNGYAPNNAIWDDFVYAVTQNNIPYEIMQAPSQALNTPSFYDWDGITVNVLNPVPGLSTSDSGSTSIGLLLSYSSKRIVLMSDVTTLSDVLNRNPSLSSDILFVPNHGCDDTSINFLSALQPSDAVVSVGTNLDGCPTSNVLSELGNYANIYRTDHLGDVQVTLYQGEYTFFYSETATYLPFVANNYVSYVSPAPTVEPTTVDIVNVNYDDTNEYVTIQNISGSDVNLFDWRISNIQGDTFILGSKVLSPNNKCDIYTNNTNGCLNWGSNAPIWDDAGDCAILRDNTEHVEDVYCYGNALKFENELKKVLENGGTVEDFRTNK